MNLTLDLARIVEQAHSLGPILDAATRAIAQKLRVDHCSVFLVEEGGELVRTPGESSNPSDGDRRSNAEAHSIAGQVTADMRTATVQGETTSLLASPLLLDESPLGAVVLQRTGRRDYSAEEIETLAAVCAQLVGIVRNTRIIEALDRGEEPRLHPAPRRLRVESLDGERAFQGVGASPGIAIGPAVFRSAFRIDLSARALPAGEPDEERARVEAAVKRTRADISRAQALAAREIDEEHALIFTSHLLLLNDPTLTDRVDQAIGRGMSAPLAIDEALGEFVARLRLGSNAYLLEKIDDVEDLRARLLGYLLGGDHPLHPGEGIVLTRRIPPSLVVELKADGAQGLVAVSGGMTSHGVLLARALRIPVVTGLPDLLGCVRPGDRLVVDGESGSVFVQPSEETVRLHAAARQRVERERTEHAKFCDILARTSDGVRVPLHANVAIASDLAVARANGAEGIGLYRTEFPFIVREAFPTRAEQVKIYRKAYETFSQQPIHFRILDLGGDKFVHGEMLDASRDAFNGYRGIRVLLDHPDVLRDQVQALALAAAARTLRIMIPMVTSLEELRRTKALIGDSLASIEESIAQRAPEIGVMIETPAAVELAADIAREVDFLSIGTNDLMQYALIADREDARMAPMSDPYHPALLRMVSRVARAARAADKSVSVCGEIAVRPDVALALVALGVDSLSVVPTAIPGLKQSLARARLEPMRRAMAGILELSDARSVAAALRDAQLA
jgi:phosphotransferase system enzyme I (PtsP)